MTDDAGEVVVEVEVGIIRELFLLLARLLRQFFLRNYTPSHFASLILWWWCLVSYDI